MPAHAIEEQAINGVDGGMVRVRVLTDDGDGTARIEVRDCGVLVRDTQQYDVPADVIRRR